MRFTSIRTLIARGLVTIAFGLLLMVWPTVSLEVFVLLFAAFAAVDGALILIAGLTAPQADQGRSIAVVAGALAVLVGAVTFLWPGVTELALVLLIALRAIVIGVAEFALGVRMRRQAVVPSTATWLLVCAGALSVAVGGALITHPRAGVLALVWAIGLYAVLLGLLVIAKAWVLTLSNREYRHAG